MKKIFNATMEGRMIRYIYKCNDTCIIFKKVIITKFRDLFKVQYLSFLEVKILIINNMLLINNMLNCLYVFAQRDIKKKFFFIAHARFCPPPATFDWYENPVLNAPVNTNSEGKKKGRKPAKK